MNRPAPLSPALAIQAALTGLISAGLLATAIFTEGGSREPSLLMIWGMVTLPGLLTPLAYLRTCAPDPADPAALTWHQQARLISRTLLLPVLWGGAAALLCGLQVFVIGIFSAALAFITPVPVPLGGIPGESLLLPPPLFWTPLIGALIRLAGHRTIRPVTDHAPFTQLRRASVLAFLLLGFLAT